VARSDTISHFIDEARARVDRALEQWLPKPPACPVLLSDAMRYSVMAGGKRLRPILTLAAADAANPDRTRDITPLALPAACAIEFIHTYSLIHDDLPAMDDDELRRGRPTCHVRFDEATAILAGDALQTLAFRTISHDEELDDSTRIALIQELSNASGTPDGMVAGQALDIEGEARAVSGKELEVIHRLKTGALIIAIRRRDGSFETTPSPDSAIELGDVLITVGTQDELRGLEEMFNPQEAVAG
jgi:geranylgeranyl pyrophosphate synthase